MGYTSFPFPPSSAIYPSATVVQSYFEAFVSHFNLAQHILLNTTVQHVDRDPSNSHWQVRLSTDETLDFDYVVVANGHYRIPRYPDIPGLDKWIASGKASHSVWYRRPLDSIGQTILIIGAGPSGHDIATELLATGSTPRTVILSVKDAPSSEVTQSLSPVFRVRGPVSAFLSGGRVMFENTDGSSSTPDEETVDHCIVATGYKIAFPFLTEDVLKPALPPPVPPLPKQLYNSTYHVFPLMKWLFPLQDRFPPTSIAFPGLVYRVAPLPFVETQALVLVKVWTDPESLDITSEANAIASRYEHFKALHGADELQIAKAFGRFEPMEQFDHRDELCRFVFGGGDDELQREEIKRRLVPEWHRKVYAHKEIVRAEWKDMVQRGEAEEFVRGVGEGGPHEWEGVVLRLLDMALERQVKGRI
jgi:Flavin-binding monooxygenase-like